MDLLERIASIAKMASAIEDHVIYDQLGDLRIEAFGLKEEILRLKEDNQKLRERLEDKAVQTFVGDCYYFGGIGPYCTCCYDAEGRKSRMHEYDNEMGTKFNSCPKCNTQTVKEKYHYDPPQFEDIVDVYDIYR